MHIPLEVTYRGLSSSHTIDEVIERRVSKLERLFGRIVACKVWLELPHLRHRRGKRFHVRVDLFLPGGERVVVNSQDADAAHEDVHVAMRDAFQACARQLHERVRIRRGYVKSHAANLRA